MKSTSPFECPDCGSDVHPNASGCRSCGARKENGEWLSSGAYDGVDFPGDDDFDYDEFIRNEFGEGPGKRMTGKQLFCWITAVITLLAFLWLSIGGW